MLCFLLVCKLICVGVIAFSEKKRKGPHARKAYEGVYDPADYRRVAAEEPGNRIKSENADSTPYKRADHGENERESVYKLHG